MLNEQWSVNERSSLSGASVQVQCALDSDEERGASGGWNIQGMRGEIDTTILSQVVVRKLKPDKDRKAILDLKAKGRAAAGKEKGTKFTPKDIMQTVD
ncbi:hypothetical protein VNO80_03455 [Phaseolus coccineus]|uniref:Uncharacterized protein n=1 Tax=Phaseolus coccineus TaxID=3886 RepID=A0AAN9RN23_PHACN